MTQRILPLRPAPITSYLHHAYPLSIFPQEMDFAPWFFSRYIQLRMAEPYDPGMDSFNFYHINMYGWPWLVKERINKSLYRRLHIPFSKFVKECIDDGCYVYAYLNERYIPQRFGYHSLDYTHDTLLYGYADNDFLLTGFTDERTYDQTVVTSAELDLAYMNSSTDTLHHQDIHILRPYAQWEFSFSLSAITRQLSDYLLSTNTSIKNAEYEQPLHGSFGIAAMNSLYEQLLTNPKFISTRDLHLLWEHKKIMLNRFAFLRKTVLPLSIEYERSYSTIVDLAQSLRNSSIKREVLQRHDSRVASGYLRQQTLGMGELLLRIIAEERPILESLYSELDHKGD